MSPLTKRTAERCLAAITEQFAPYLQAGVEHPILKPPDENRRHWAIAWGDGPEDWASRAFVGGLSEEVYHLALDAGAVRQDAVRIATERSVECPAGVHAEPISFDELGLYPA